MDIEIVRSRFIKHFDGKTGSIYFAPGRINLIGEHTDYNGGFVFPGAVDKGIMAEVRPNGTDTIMLYSIDLKDRVEFKVNDFPMEEIMFDPQTSGGLLISLPEKYGEELLEKLNKLEIKSAIVGKVVKRQEKDVVIL